MSETYKNLVFTKHAWERIKDRSLSKDVIYQTVSSPNKTFHNKDNFKFIRTISGRRIHVVATPIENNKFLVISTWVRGEEDKVPLMWQIISLPFKLVWWIIKTILRSIIGKR
jgi:hypothetical protein